MFDSTFRTLTSVYLDRATPIIQALLGSFIRSEIPCYHRRTHLLLDDGVTVDWNVVHDRLIQVARDLGLVNVAPNPCALLFRPTSTPCLNTAQLIQLLGDRLDPRHISPLEAVIQRTDLSGRMTLETALSFAWRLNDGHHLFAAKNHRVIRFLHNIRIPVQPEPSWYLSRNIAAVLAASNMATRSRALATLEDLSIRRRVRRWIAAYTFDESTLTASRPSIGSRSWS